MQFEVKLPFPSDTCFLGRAGLNTDEYHARYMDVIIKKAPLPTNVSCPYFLSENTADVRVSVLRYSPTAHLKIVVSDAAVGEKVKEYLTRYSADNDGAALADREHKHLWNRVEAILGRDGTTYEDLQYGRSLLTRRAIEALMELCDNVRWYEKGDIHCLLSDHYVAKPDREFNARWLLKLLEAERDPHQQISVRVWELAVPQIAGELIRLIQAPAKERNEDVFVWRWPRPSTLAPRR